MWRGLVRESIERTEYSVAADVEDHLLLVLKVLLAVWNESVAEAGGARGESIVD